jgi:hypothetical protein
MSLEKSRTSNIALDHQTNLLPRHEPAGGKVCKARLEFSIISILTEPFPSPGTGFVQRFLKNLFQSKYG